MLRSAARSATCALGITGTRSIFQFSGSNPVLQHNAEHRGFQDTIWVEDKDEYWWKPLGVTVRSGEMPTECEAPNRIELYNMDQVVNPPDTPKNMDVHGIYSFKTKKRYSGGFAQKLDEFASANKLDSKWWLSPAELRRLNLKAKNGTVPCVQVITRPLKFYNASQFSKPEAIQMNAYSGATGRAYEATIGSYLKEHAKSIGAPSCVYFTPKQAEAMGLQLPIGVTLADVPLQERVDYAIYSVDDVENSAEFLKSLQRFPVSTPTMVISGQPLKPDLLAAVSGTTTKSNYWVTKHEVTARSYKLKPDAKAVAPPKPAGMDNCWHAVNSFQFPNKEAVFKAVGRYVPVPYTP